jgi:hypothetical protein
MADNVFSEGVRDDPDAGLPNVMDLVFQAATLVQRQPAGFLLAGLIPAVVIVGSTFVALFVVYVSFFLGTLLGGFAGGQDEAAVLGGLGVMSLALLGLVVLLVGISTPIWASLYRAVWRLLVHDEPLSAGSAFSTMSEDLGAQFLYTLLSGAIVLLGLCLCYVPGLLAQGMLVFAWPAVVIHRMPVGRALSWSVGHALAHPAWHLGLWAVNFALSLILPNIPLLGYLLLFTVQPLFVLLAYRAAAGDGEAPRDAA